MITELSNLKDLFEKFSHLIKETECDLWKDWSWFIEI